MPALVTVNVEPRSSSGLSVPARAASASRATSAASSSSDAVSQPRTTGTTRPCVGLHGDAEVVAVEVDDLVAVEARVQLGELLQRSAQALQHASARAGRGRRSVKSHSSTQVTAGTSRCARAMCSAISAAHAAQRLAAALAGRVRGRPASGRAAHVVLGDPPLRARCRSTTLESTPSSWAIRRTSGVARTRLPPARPDCPGSDPDWLGQRGAARHALGAVVADHDEHRPDRDDLALRDEDPRHLAGGRRRDLDRRLVGLDLDERVVLGDLLALGDEPARDLALGQALAEVGQLELVRHGGGFYREAGRPRHRRRHDQHAQTRRRRARARRLLVAASSARRPAARSSSLQRRARSFPIADRLRSSSSPAPARAPAARPGSNDASTATSAESSVSSGTLERALVASARLAVAVRAGRAVARAETERAVDGIGRNSVVPRDELLAVEVAPHTRGGSAMDAGSGGGIPSGRRGNAASVALSARRARRGLPSSRVAPARRGARSGRSRRRRAPTRVSGVDQPAVDGHSPYEARRDTE